MPRMVDAARSVAANAVTGNIFAGQLYEFPPGASAVRLYSVAAAPGILVTFTIGGLVIVQDQEISGANRFPIIPDDFVAEFGAAPGDRIIVTLRNRTAAAIVANTFAEVDPIG